jgi:hypothetical protein
LSVSTSLCSQMLEMPPCNVGDHNGVRDIPYILSVV